MNTPQVDSDHSPKQNGKISSDNLKQIAKRFWKFLNTNSSETFLDADVREVTRGIIKFLNKDIIGQKIIFLTDKDKLDETASDIAIFLKRQRHLLKNQEQTKPIQQVKSLHHYFNHSFWDKNEQIMKIRGSLQQNMRRMTPNLLKNLVETRKQFEVFLDMEAIWDNSILQDEHILNKDAEQFGYKLYTVCQKYQEPIALNKKNQVFCSFKKCQEPRCPFGKNIARERETVFFSEFHTLLEKMGKIK